MCKCTWGERVKKKSHAMEPKTSKQPAKEKSNKQSKKKVGGDYLLVEDMVVYEEDKRKNQVTY